LQTAARQTREKNKIPLRENPGAFSGTHMARPPNRRHRLRLILTIGGARNCPSPVGIITKKAPRMIAAMRIETPPNKIRIHLGVEFMRPTFSYPVFERR